MKFKRNLEVKWMSTEETDWFPKFIWWPTVIGAYWVWLETVECKLTANGLDWSETFRMRSP